MTQDFETLINCSDQFMSPVENRTEFYENMKVPDAPQKLDEIPTNFTSECLIAEFEIDDSIEIRLGKCEKTNDDKCYDIFQKACGQILNDSENWKTIENNQAEK